MINRRLSSKTIFEGTIINLRIDEVELPDGRRSTREIIEHPGAVVIVPIDSEGNVHMVRQYRDAIEEVLLELPAGKLDEGEEPLACARRELREELGLVAERWLKLATYYASPGFCDEVMHLYLAEGLSTTENDLDHEEFLEPVVLPLEPLDGLLGQLKDSKSLTGALLAHKVIGSR